MNIRTKKNQIQPRKVNTFIRVMASVITAYQCDFVKIAPAVSWQAFLRRIHFVQAWKTP